MIKLLLTIIGVLMLWGLFLVLVSKNGYEDKGGWHSGEEPTEDKK